MVQPAERRYKIEGRERADWDGAALAQLVIELARARVAARQAKRRPPPRRSASKGTAR